MSLHAPSTIQQDEVEWYRKHGQHPRRLAKDSSGNLFVIGDWAWNRNNRPAEYVDKAMLEYSLAKKPEAAR